MKSSLFWQRYVAGALAACLVAGAMTLAVPNDESIKSITQLIRLLVLMSFSVIALIGIKKNRPTHVKTWLLFSISPLLIFAGIISSAVDPTQLDIFPSLDEYFYLFALISCVAFLAVVLRKRSSGADGAGVLDATIIVVGASLVSWMFIIEPTATMEKISLSTKLYASSLPILDLVTVWLCIRMAFGRENRSVAYWLLLASSIGAVGVDSFTALEWLGLQTTIREHAIVDLIRDVVFVAYYSTAIHPSMKTLTVRVPRREATTVDYRRLVLIAIASMIAPVMLITEYNDSRNHNLLVLGAGAGVMFLLVVARMAGMLRKQTEVVAELDDSLRRLREAEVQLRHAQKLEAVGKLAAGVAHEINTPLQYVTGNLSFIDTTFHVMQEHVASYQALLPNVSMEDGKERERREELQMFDVEIPEALESVTSGLARIATIVGAMKAFGEAPKADLMQSNINQAVVNTLTICANEIDDVADVTTELQATEFPFCFPADINQSLLHIVINASHAIRDAQLSERGMIVVRTFNDDTSLQIEITDNGVGMSPETLERIFEPFFTTREVGKGTGQGLAVVWNLIVERHSGTISVESAIGEGTKFIVRLPLMSTQDASNKFASKIG